MEILIELVRERPVLWDTSLTEYRDNLMKDKAWDEVARSMDEEKKTVKDKWKKLRDSHRQAMLRRKTTTEQAASTIKRWKYEDQMQFLALTMAHRSSDSNVPPPDDVIRPVVPVPEAGDDRQNTEEDNTELQLEEDEFGTPANSPSPRTEKRKRPAKAADKILNFMKEKHEQKMQLKQPKTVDKLDLFLASFGQSMRKLPRRQLHKVKISILNAIAAAEEETEWEAELAAPRVPVPQNNASNSNSNASTPSATFEIPEFISQSIMLANNSGSFY